MIPAVGLFPNKCSFLVEEFSFIIKLLRILKGWRSGSVVKSSCHSLRGSRFNSRQNGAWQTSVTPSLGNLTASSGFHSSRHSCGAQAPMQTKHINKHWKIKDTGLPSLSSLHQIEMIMWLSLSLWYHAASHQLVKPALHASDLTIIMFFAIWYGYR